MKLQRKNNKWFTLIELLVVITIIGILATWGTAIYTSQIQRSRDATRLQDINVLKSWVEMIYQDEAEYPTTDSEFGTLIAQYVQKIPIDPKNGATCNQNGTATTVACAYAYRVAPDTNGIDNWAYEISTAFENTWNINSKGENDGWEDDLRQEIWLLKTGIAKNDIVTVLASDDVWSDDKGLCISNNILVVSGNPEDAAVDPSACGG